MSGSDWSIDVSRFAEGNTGVPYVWTFASDNEGPHVMVNCLTHGNEPAGAHAVARLLDEAVRPRRGRLTFSFANVRAYESFRAGQNLPARFLDRDMNRLWRDDWIDADRTSRETVRARELRPVLRTVDMLLDLHTTASVARPFFVIAEMPKTRALADRMAWPPLQQLMPGGCLDGRHMIDYDAFSDPVAPQTAVTVECGRHDDATSGEAAYRTARLFLAAVGALSGAARASEAASIHRYRIVAPYEVRHDSFVLSIPDSGFVSVEEGETVARDGPEKVTAPYDAVVIAPRPSPAKGTTAFLWAVEVSP